MLTEILTGDPLAIKRWSNHTFIDAIGETYVSRFMGSSKDSIIRVHKDLSKAAGDEVKYDLLMQIGGHGVFGDTRVKGQEKKLDYFQDSLKINQQREAVLRATMSQQRTHHDILDDASVMLSKFFGRNFDQFTLAFACGTAGTAGAGPALSTAITAYSANSLRAADSGHLITTGAAFTLDNFRKLNEKASLATPIVQPTMVDGQPKRVVLLRPEAVTSLKSEVGSSKWNERHAIASERGRTNPIYTGALGEWDNCVIHESIYLPRDTGGTQLNYGVMLGAGALSMAFGQSYSTLGGKPKKETGSMFSLFVDTDDYGNEEGIAGGTIWGVQKNRFNSTDLGTMLITSLENAQ
jgi:N4-gp56 family major capsid protein